MPRVNYCTCHVRPNLIPVSDDMNDRLSTDLFHLSLRDFSEEKIPADGEDWHL
jgi:hypothetical protein